MSYTGKCETARALARKLFSSRERRTCVVFALICAWWCCWYPLNMLSLFTAIPEEASIAFYSKGLAAEWKGLVSHPQIIPALEKLGINGASELKRDKGFYQTLYWLTGRHTVIGVKAHPDDIVADTRLYGASYVGWKAKIMELMWRFKYVPGLGRLDVSDSGTRYMVFRRSKTMRKLGIVLSLDIVDGHLLAVLSHDPDAVLELSERLTHGADLSSVFWDDATPWNTPRPRKYPNHFWIPPATSMRWTGMAEFGAGRIDVGFKSFQKENLGICINLPLDCDADPMAPLQTAELPPITGDSVFARIVLSGSALTKIFPPDGDVISCNLSVFLAGRADRARLCGLAIPQALAVIPTKNAEETDDLFMKVLRLFRAVSKFETSDADNCQVLDLQESFAAKMIPPEGRPFVAKKGNSVFAGSSLSAGFELYGKTIFSSDDVCEGAWLRADIDFEKAEVEIRNLSSVIQLFGRMGVKGVRKASQTAKSISMYASAMSGFGVAAITVRPDDHRMIVSAETHTVE